MINSPHTRSTIDPTQGLIDYVNAVKPYHSKILDVLVEYVYTEAITVNVQERWKWSDQFYNTPVEFFDALPPTLISTAFTGSILTTIVGPIHTTVLTVTAVFDGTLSVGQEIYGLGVLPNTIILTQLTGSPGGIGTYVLSTLYLAPVSSEPMVATHAPDMLTTTTISETFGFDIHLELSDSISATLADIRPVGYGLDTYGAATEGFGTVGDPEGLGKTAVGSGIGDAFTVRPDGFDLDTFDE